MAKPKRKSAVVQDIRSQRYVALLEHLARQAGRPRRGWQSQVAKRLGIDPAYVSKILKGERTSIGDGVLELAIRNVPIARQYFTHEHAEPPEEYISVQIFEPLPPAREKETPNDRFLSFALMRVLGARNADNGADRAAQYRALAQMVLELHPDVLLARRILDADDDVALVAAGDALADRVVAGASEALKLRSRTDKDES